MATDPRRASLYSTHSQRRSVAGSQISRKSRSHSAVKDNLVDIRRHVNSVALNSQALAEKFADQLKKYKTFAPIFATEGVYAQSLFPTLVSANTAIDQILDSHTSFLVRHTTHHRIAPSADESDKSADATRRPVVSIEDPSDDGSPTGAHASPTVLVRVPMPPGSVPPTEEDDSAFLVWKHEHPEATTEEIGAVLRRRNKERIDVERANRSKYMRKWHAELELALEEDEKATAAAPAPPKEVLPPRPPPRRYSVYDVEMQKIAWDVFNNGDNNQTTIGAADGRRHSLHAVVGDAEEAEKLHRWVEQEWQSHTHRHEAAALRVQCAFRCHRAKQAVHRARYLRRQEHQEMLKSEEEVMFAWKVAVELKNEEHTSKKKETDDGLEKTLRSINFFIQSINAKVRRRRAERDRHLSQDFELESFAAQRIQAVYRGHRGRQMVNELRHPEIAEKRRYAVQMSSAVLIQKMWKGYAVRIRLAKWQASAVRIQCNFRKHVATKQLAKLRRDNRSHDQASLEAFASDRIKHFLFRQIGQRRKKLEKLLPIFAILYRMCSGYRARKAMTAAYKRRIDALHHACAIKIQSQYRRHIAKMRVEVMREENNALAHLEDLHIAAVTIQRVVRGRQGRKRAKTALTALRASRELQRLADSATIIQAAFRGHRDRQVPIAHAMSNRDSRERPAQQPQQEQKLYDFHRFATVRSAYAGQTRLSLQNKPNAVEDDAALIIQEFYFAKVRWPRLVQTIRSSGATIAKSMKRSRAAASVKERREEQAEKGRDDAALTIQTSLRAHLARQVTATLRQLRDASFLAIRQNEATVTIACFLRHVVTKRRIQRLHPK